MNKNEILDVLQDWNLWTREGVSGVPRPTYADKLSRLLKTDQVLTITGPRRAGKSFLMRQAAHRLTESGVQKTRILHVNFEDPRFTELDVKLMDRIYDTYLEFMQPVGQPFLFLDEIQEIEGWEKWVRSMHERQKAKLIISGSNARLLSRELGTLLTGRHLDLVVFPLSFREFLAFNNIRVDTPLDLVSNRAQIIGFLRKYIEFGGFPAVTLSTEKKELLLNYFEDLLNKDLLRRFKIRKPQEMRALVKFCLTNVATLTTYSSLENFLKMSASTIDKFSGYLEQVYLVFFLKRLSFKVREQEKSPRKVYAIDPGLSNAIGFRFSENIGRLAENVVFLELKRQQTFNAQLEFFYWKDIHHREVDFVVKEGTGIKELIQVCWNVDDHKTKDREIRSLLKAMEELHADNASIITEGLEAQEDLEGKNIRFIPLWKWLLLLNEQPI